MKQLILIVGAAILIGCSGASKGPGAGKEDQDEKVTSEPSSGMAAKTGFRCDKSLWDHVYKPERIEVRDQCLSATGTIDELDQNEDGDTHMLLKLDEGQADLLVRKNRKKKGNELVVEVVCGGPVKDKKVGDVCKDFTNPVRIPKVGDHVRVTGTYVIDSHNGWAEIHPASKIDPK